MEKGRLVIHFDVKFPNKGDLHPENIGLLETLLPSRTQVKIPMDAEECILTEYDPRQSRSNRNGMYGGEDDPRGHEGPTQVSCASH